MQVSLFHSSWQDVVFFMVQVLGLEILLWRCFFGIERRCLLENFVIFLMLFIEILHVLCNKVGFLSIVANLAIILHEKLFSSKPIMQL